MTSQRLSIFLNAVKSYSSSSLQAIMKPLSWNLNMKQPSTDEEAQNLLPEAVYNEFLRKLSSPENEHIQRGLESFLAVTEALPPEESSSRVVNFIDNFTKQLCSEHQWKLAEASAAGKTVKTVTIDASNCVREETENSRLISECLEKYIMTKLHHATFAPTEVDIARDVAFIERITSLSFIRPSHLGLSNKYFQRGKASPFWAKAQEELLNMNAHKTPLDKLLSILSCSRNIFKAVAAATGSAATVGADDFLPLLIYVILRSNPPNIHSNIQYISRFRHPAKLNSEIGYYFVHFESAIAFIETVDASGLDIDPEDYERGIRGEALRDAEWVVVSKQGTAEIKSESELLLDDLPPPTREQATQTAIEEDLGLVSRVRSTEVQEAQIHYATDSDAAKCIQSEWLQCSAEELGLEDARRLLEDYRRLAEAVLHTTSSQPTGNGSPMKEPASAVTSSYHL